MLFLRSVIISKFIHNVKNIQEFEDSKQTKSEITRKYVHNEKYITETWDFVGPVGIGRPFPLALRIVCRLCDP